MLAAGIIEPSFSKWSNLIVIIKKPNGNLVWIFVKLIVCRRRTYTRYLTWTVGLRQIIICVIYFNDIWFKPDLSQAYFQIPLAEVVAKLLCSMSWIKNSIILSECRMDWRDALNFLAPYYEKISAGDGGMSNIMLSNIFVRNWYPLRSYVSRF